MLHYILYQDSTFITNGVVLILLLIRLLNLSFSKLGGAEDVDGASPRQNFLELVATDFQKNIAASTAVTQILHHVPAKQRFKRCMYCIISTKGKCVPLYFI